MIRHMRKHVEGGYCPACRQEFKNISQHLATNAEKDDLHMILYATVVRLNATNGKRLRAMRDRAIELMELLETGKAEIRYNTILPKRDQNERD
jgi:hypothetical protein